jgi:hypothetical protein
VTCNEREGAEWRKGRRRRRPQLAAPRDQGKREQGKKKKKKKRGGFGWGGQPPDLPRLLRRVKISSNNLAVEHRLGLNYEFVLKMAV